MDWINQLIEWLQSLFSQREISSVQTPAVVTNNNASTPKSAPGFNSIQWTKYDYFFKFWGGVHSVDWQVLKAIALNESTLGINARVASGMVSDDGKSYGIMQVTFPTAKDMKGRAVSAAELNSPEFSIELAAKYFRWIIDYIEENVTDYKAQETDLDLAVQAYNCGVGNIRKGVRVPEYLARFNRNYALVEKYQ